MACVSGDKLCGIPGEVMDILAAMQCQKLGKPTWTVFSTGGGLGVKLFWRNGNRGTRTPINANQREKPKLRKQRDQRRLEEFNRKKRQERTPNVEGVMQPVTEPGKPASELRGIPASMRCDNDQAGEILEGEVSTETDLVPTLADGPEDPTLAELSAPPLPVALPVTPPTKDSATLATGDQVDLHSCTSVKYDVRDGTHGVKFKTKHGLESWTPVKKGAVGPLTQQKRDGSRHSPRMCQAEELDRHLGKEVTYFQIDGTPGLRFRRGKTTQSYEWTPIAPSPIASRTRIKTMQCSY